jgi:hypothetical protein
LGASSTVVQALSAMLAANPVSNRVILTIGSCIPL